MTTQPLQKIFEACQANKSAWLQRRDELRQVEQAYRERVAGSGHCGRSLQMLRSIIDVKKWEMNWAAGRYIRMHEELQCISIRNRLNDFMQQNGTALAAALASEQMNYFCQYPAVQHCAMQSSGYNLQEALLVWLAPRENINYCVQDNDILTYTEFRPDTAYRDNNREKFTPVQNLN